MIAGEGQIIRFDHRVGFDGDDYYYPIIMFRDEDGTPMQVVSPYGYSTSERFKIGDTVRIEFDRRSPSRARIAGQSRLFIRSLALQVALLVLAAGVLILLSVLCMI